MISWILPRKTVVSEKLYVIYYKHPFILHPIWGLVNVNKAEYITAPNSKYYSEPVKISSIRLLKYQIPDSKHPLFS
jgi:hypothetical protein